MEGWTRPITIKQALFTRPNLVHKGKPNSRSNSFFSASLLLPPDWGCKRVGTAGLGRVGELARRLLMRTGAKMKPLLQTETQLFPGKDWFCDGLALPTFGLIKVHLRCPDWIDDSQSFSSYRLRTMLLSHVIAKIKYK